MKDIRKYFGGYEKNARIITIDEDSPDVTTISGENLLVHCKPGVKKRIIQKEPNCNSLRVYVDRNSELEFASMLPSFASFYVGNNAGLKLFCCNLGGNDAAETLIEMGDNAQAEDRVYFICTGEKKVDINVKIVHSGKNSTSRLLTRGIVDGRADAKCTGLIEVEKNASSSDGYQDNNCLILSDNARIQFLPLLKIRNPDVRCSHDAKVTHVDGEKMFYLQSRGLLEEDAKRMIVEGFILGGGMASGMREMLGEIMDGKMAGIWG